MLYVHRQNQSSGLFIHFINFSLNIENYIVGHELVVADACCKLHGIGRILLNVEQTATAIFCIICSVVMGGNCMVAAAKLVIYSVLPKKMRRKMR
jgi:hypothetical protein